MKVINYSDEHIHILSRANGETCHLSRNWNRCTAGTDHQLKDADPIRKREDALYHDGNEWRDARKEHVR
jgi:hypothetical protein